MWCRSVRSFSSTAEVASAVESMPDVRTVVLVGMAREITIKNTRELKLDMAASAPWLLVGQWPRKGGRQSAEDDVSFTPEPLTTNQLLVGMLLAAGHLKDAKRQTGRTAPQLPAHLLGAQFLVVDDNAINQLVAVRQIEAMGGCAHAVGSGEEAIVMVQQRQYSAVLMDLRMGGIGGTLATRRIRQLKGEVGNTPVVALTATDTAASRAACKQAGMDAFVAKPIAARDLVEALSRAIGSPDKPGPLISSLPPSSETIPMPMSEPLSRPVSAPISGQEPESDAPRGRVEQGRPPGATAAERRASTVGQQRLDAASLDRIRATGSRGHNLLQRLVDMFRNSATDRLKATRKAIDKRRFDDAARMLHALKGSALTLGANRLSHHIIRTEFAAEQSDFDAAIRRLERCDLEAVKTLSALDSYLAGFE